MFLSGKTAAKNSQYVCKNAQYFRNFCQYFRKNSQYFCFSCPYFRFLSTFPRKKILLLSFRQRCLKCGAAAAFHAFSPCPWCRPRGSFFARPSSLPINGSGRRPPRKGRRRPLLECYRRDDVIMLLRSSPSSTCERSSGNASWPCSGKRRRAVQPRRGTA